LWYASYDSYIVGGKALVRLRLPQPPARRKEIYAAHYL
jgi:hypothetical protein